MKVGGGSRIMVLLISEHENISQQSCVNSLETTCQQLHLSLVLIQQDLITIC